MMMVRAEARAEAREQTGAMRTYGEREGDVGENARDGLRVGVLLRGIPPEGLDGLCGTRAKEGCLEHACGHEAGDKEGDGLCGLLGVPGDVVLDDTDGTDIGMVGNRSRENEINRHVEGRGGKGKRSRHSRSKNKARVVEIFELTESRRVSLLGLQSRSRGKATGVDLIASNSAHSTNLGRRGSSAPGNSNSMHCTRPLNTLGHSRKHHTAGWRQVPSDGQLSPADASFLARPPLTDRRPTNRPPADQQTAGRSSARQPILRRYRGYAARLRLTVSPLPPSGASDQVEQQDCHYRNPSPPCSFSCITSTPCGTDDGERRYVRCHGPWHSLHTQPTPEPHAGQPICLNRGRRRRCSHSHGCHAIICAGIASNSTGG